MKTKIMLVAMVTLLIGSLCFWACQKEFDVNESDYLSEKDATAEFPEETAEGYLIGFHNTPDPALILRAGGSIIRTYNNFPILHVNIPEQALAGLSRAPGISFVEPNNFWTIFGNYSESCPTNNLVCAEGQIKTFHMSRIGVQAVWRSGVTGQGIRIAILDTGIDGNHKDLKDNLASDGFSVITTGSPPSRHWLVDRNGHGTHVAGTAGASGKLNGSYNALLGVAPGVTLVSVKVLRENAFGSWADIAAGIDWCVDNNVQILNMSLGGSESSSTLELAVQKAWNAGLLIVSSAGNTGVEELRYPAAYDQVIAVAAANQQVDEKATFSTMGSFVELIAPGSRVFSTHINDYSYHYMNGTSMASPHVAGVASLIWSANPSLTNQQVRDLLNNNTECLELPPNHQGHGLVRADKAMGIETGRVKGLVYADNQPVYAANLTFSSGSNTYSTTSSGEVGYTIIVAPGTYTATASFNYGYDPVSTEVTVNANEIAVIDFSLTDGDPDPDPVYTITGTVTDFDNNSTLSGATVSIDGTNYSAITGTDGSFEILNVIQGNYYITASLAGYISKTENITVYENTTVNFVLEKDDDPGDPVDPGDPEPGELSIDDFTLTNTSNPQIARVLVNWEVSGENLSNGTLSISGPNSEEIDLNVSGNTASGEHEFSFRRGHGDYTVTLTVTDSSGTTLTETKNITL